LYVAAGNNDLHGMYKLLAVGANMNYKNVDENNCSPIHKAAENGHLVCVELLIQQGANVNAVDNKGWTALHYAAFHDHTNVASLLFKRGANLDCKDIEGKSALDIAVANQRADCVTLLRLAQLVLQERKDDTDESFREALNSFSLDAFSLNEKQSEKQPQSNESDDE